ncbi:MAG: ABC transporter ATP-binding protein [Planctomycetes bacterium]|nr:ABC transporter ATP-binding protein [Planctomycetota bacterium]
MKFLEIMQVSKHFSHPTKGRIEVLDKVSLEMRRNEFITIIGHSGCGKSTLLNMVAGLDAPSSGAVCFKEREIARPGPERAVVFQNHSLLPWRTVLANVMLAVDAVFPAIPKGERLAKAEHWLGVVGLKEQLHKYPHEISGGQKQRTGLARALAMGPELMLFDEPFGALDELTRSQLQDESLRLHGDEHLSVFMVTHSVDEAIYMSDRVVMMNNGPNATIGRIVDIDFPRPRERLKVFESELFAHYRNECIRFLFSRRHGAQAAAGLLSEATVEPVPGVPAPA